MRDHVGDPHDGVADELPGAVVGDAPAAVGGHDLEATRTVEVLAERQLLRPGAPAAGVDGGVLEQQQRVGQLSGLATRGDVQLDGERLAVGDRAEVADPEVVGRAATLIHGRLWW